MGDTRLTCLHLETAVEVSRIQREPAPSAEYKIILMPGFCLHPLASTDTLHSVPAKPRHSGRLR
jgi:hypothetical protein